MQDIINVISPTWYKKDGASSEQLEQLKSQLKFKLPFEYESFLTWSNGGEGRIGNNYFSLWNCEQVPRRNVSTQINFYLPGVLGIATDGGDYCYALDYTISDTNPPLVLVPLGDLDFTSFVTIGSSFIEGLRNLLTTDF